MRRRARGSAWLGALGNIGSGDRNVKAQFFQFALSYRLAAAASRSFGKFDGMANRGGRTRVWGEEVARRLSADAMDRDDSAVLQFGDEVGVAEAE